MASLILRLFSLMALLVLVSVAAWGQQQEEPYRRSVSFEWDAIEGAEFYELIIRSLGDSKLKLQFRPRENNWSGRLPPGHYEMITRSLDRRGVPGEWAPPTAFDVTLEKPVLVAPQAQASLSVKEESETTVRFEWKAVGGARDYEIEVMSRDNGFTMKEKTSELTFTRELPVAKAFTWKLRALGPEDLTSEAQGEFTLVGPRLTKPKLEQPENDFVREVKWEAIPWAKTYDVEVHRFNPVKKAWESVALSRNLSENQYPIDLKWPGGLYQVNILAKADGRQPSPEASLRFRLRNGDRSPAAEETAEIRKSIDRVNGWYGIASYLVTVVSYQSSNLDKDQEAGTKFNALGGTGRLGVGQFLRDRSFGFLAIADLSGFLNERNQNLTYISSELSAVWRRYFTRRSELRVQFGGFYKELPVAIGDRETLKVKSYSNAAILGPHLGLEFWYSLTSKMGLQLNLHLYQGLKSFSTPNGLEAVPTLSSQIGFLGSYRLGPRATGLAGYARRDDRVRYGSTSGQANDVQMTGDYVNFFLEYGF